MKTKLLKPTIVMTILVITLINLAGAVSFTGIITNTPSNITINVTSEISFDTLINHDEGWIYFENYYTTGSNEEFTFNITNEINSSIKGIIWFSSSTSTNKHIASNLTSTINSSVILSDINCETIGTITYTSHTGAYTRTWNYEDYTCTDGSIQFNNIPIEPASGSNVFSLTYNQAIRTICDESDSSFLEAASIAGILLTIILIGGVITVLFLGFSGVIDLDGLSKSVEGISLTEVIYGILVVGLVFLVIATLSFLIGGNYCPAIGG